MGRGDWRNLANWPHNDALIEPDVNDTDETHDITELALTVLYCPDCNDGVAFDAITGPRVKK